MFKDGFAALIPEIAKDKALYDVFYSVKNSYHQTVSGTNGVIGGRYPLILELVAKIKQERERIRTGIIATQQAHRTELEEARAAVEESQASAKATRKTKATKVRFTLVAITHLTRFTLEEEVQGYCGRRRRLCL